MTVTDLHTRQPHVPDERRAELHDGIAMLAAVWDADALNAEQSETIAAGLVGRSRIDRVDTIADLYARHEWLQHNSDGHPRREERADAALSAAKAELAELVAEVLAAELVASNVITGGNR